MNQTKILDWFASGVNATLDITSISADVTQLYIEVRYNPSGTVGSLGFPNDYAAGTQMAAYSISGSNFATGAYAFTLSSSGQIPQASSGDYICFLAYAFGNVGSTPTFTISLSSTNFVVPGVYNAATYPGNRSSMFFIF